MLFQLMFILFQAMLMYFLDYIFEYWSINIKHILPRVII